MPRREREPAPVTLLPGVRVAMGGRDWVIPPLTVGQLRRLGPQLSISADGTPLAEETLDAMVAVITPAMQRNYPGLDQAEVAELLDMGNVGAVLGAVLGASGLKAVSSGEDQAAGNDGTSSTASSPPALATARATSTS